jgi:hypothetical protein
MMYRVCHEKNGKKDEEQNSQSWSFRHSSSTAAADVMVAERHLPSRHMVVTTGCTPADLNIALHSLSHDP